MNSLRLFSRQYPKICAISVNIHGVSYSVNYGHQNELFDAEKERQKQKLGRIEKIEVNYIGRSENAKLQLNKNISTPYHATKHISEWLSTTAALALVNKELWDIHRPLEGDCDLNVLTFTDSDPFHVNKAFWRTCSFLLGAVIKRAFKSDIPVFLHSFPSPKVASGSFVHDALLDLPTEWSPGQDELRCLSAELVKLSHQELSIERLQVDQSVALEMFKQNKFKLQQIPDIAHHSDNKITLYRAGDHIDISKGPMIGNSSLIGRATVTAVHKIRTEDGILYRFQGVALPRGLMLNHFAYQILEERARKLNLNEAELNEKVELAI